MAGLSDRLNCTGAASSPQSLAALDVLASPYPAARNPLFVGSLEREWVRACRKEMSCRVNPWFADLTIRNHECSWDCIQEAHVLRRWW